MATSETPTGIVGAHARAETEGTAVREKMHKGSAGLRNILLFIVVLAAVVIGGYQIFPKLASGEGILSLSLAGRLFVAAIVIFLASPIGKLAEMFGVPKSENVAPIVRAAGITALLFFLAFSASGQRIGREIDHIDNCIGHSDCSQRSDDIPYTNGGTVRLGPGDSTTFYAQGKVRITNYKDYCLDFEPDELFYITWTSDVLNVYIEPRSGKKELVTVTSEKCN